MVKKQEPSTPAAGGAIPSPSGSRNRYENAEARKFKKQAAPTNPVRSHDESGGAAGRPPTACPRRSARLSGRHPEHPTLLDDADKECKVRGNQSAMVTVRRSARFQQGDRSLTKPLVKKESYHTPLLPRKPSRQNFAHNIKTQNAVKKDNKQENPARSSQRSASAKASARMKTHKELPTVYEDSQDVPARRKAAYPSCKNSEMQEPKPSCCEERKRGTSRKPSSRKQNHQKLSGMKEGVQLQLCVSDDWTEEQDLILRQACFTARPTPHFSKKFSKMECEVRGNQSAMPTVRRSARLQQGDRTLSKPLLEKESYHTPLLPRKPSHQDVTHNIKTQNAVKKDKKQENLARSSQRCASVKASGRMKKHKELPTVYEDSQDVPARRKAADASCKNSEMQEPKPSCCEERKRGTARKPSSRKQNHQKLSGIKEGIQLQLCASDDWTEEQDLRLRQAFFTARPSPHFWKKVSKMVPGKSAEDCFNRVHADLKTPSPIAPRPRSKTQFSPLGHFTLSHPKLPNLLEPLAGRKRTAKQKSLLAQKTVRHLLKEHSLIDQAQEADHFAIFETSPLNILLADSPGTPYLKSFSLHKYSVSSSGHKKPLSRLKTKQDEPSPAVLKPLRNPVLHERYINQLSRREGAKKPRKKAAGTNATDRGRPLSEQKAGSVKACLISSAADFISQFKKLQSNSLAHVLENSEDDEDNSVY